MKKLFGIMMVCGYGSMFAHYGQRPVLSAVLFITMVVVGMVTSVIACRRILLVQAYRYHVLGRLGRDHYFGDR